MPQTDSNCQALTSLVIMAEKCLIPGAQYTSKGWQRQIQMHWTCMLSASTSTRICSIKLSLKKNQNNHKHGIYGMYIATYGMF